MKLKSAIIATVAGILLVVAGFVAGFNVGAAPLRRSMALSGGPSGQIATGLNDAANHLSDPKGSYSENEVVAKQIRLAEAQSVLAAQFYCKMTPAYRRLAQRAATRLSASPYLQNTPSTRGREARAYIIQTAADISTCPRFATR